MWWIQSVYVHPEYRKKGVFKVSFLKIMEMANKADVKEVRLYVERDNRDGQKVYELFGMVRSPYYLHHRTILIRVLIQIRAFIQCLQQHHWLIQFAGYA